MFFGFRKISIQNMLVFVWGYKCVCILFRFSDYELGKILVLYEVFSIQFVSHSTDPIQGHQEHMDMEIVR